MKTGPIEVGSRVRCTVRSTSDTSQEREGVVDRIATYRANGIFGQPPGELRINFYMVKLPDQHYSVPVFPDDMIEVLD